MRATAIHRAVLALILAILTTAPLGTACAQSFGRSLWRVEERSRGQERRQGPARRQEGGRPAYAPGPVYAYPRNAPGQAYAPAPYAPPAYPPSAYGYPPRSVGVAPNSLGAGWGQQQDEARRGVRQGLQPMGRVMANISRIAPGRMLDAGLEPGPGGRPAYRVRWAAANGRRIDFIVDAATGAIIGSSGY